MFKDISMASVMGVCLLFSGPGPAFAQEADIPSIRDDISRTMGVEKKIQRLKTDWNEESRALSLQLEQLKKDKQDLEKFLDKQNLRLDLEEKKYQENQRREKETIRVKTQLSAFLDSVLEKLETSVTEGLPFLGEERNGRIASLRKMMVDPSESSAEKFRRVFEALQIETEYGTTVEVTQQTIDLGESRILADVFRLGRISLFCQSIDRKKSGVFDPGSKIWLSLPQSTNRDIGRAIAMARLERSIELVKLPLGRIVKP